MNNKLKTVYAVAVLIIMCGCAGTPPATAQAVPNWVTSLENAYPSKDWIAVNGQKHAKCLTLESGSVAFSGLHHI
jgi:type IV pilus biogenesis protein CpaD/CtpE